MRVNIDLNGANDYSGIGNYIKNIAKLLDSRNYIDYHGCNFWHRKYNRGDYDWFKGKHHLSLVYKYFAYQNKYRLPLYYEWVLGSMADLNVFLTYKLPNTLFYSPVVSTIHDIILLKTNCEPDNIVSTHKKVLERTIRESSFILTVSESSKKDLIENFNLSDNQIFIVHNGIDLNIFGTDCVTMELNRVRNKYHLPQNYILNFGGYRRHKNIERLLHAYSQLPMAIRHRIKVVLTREHPAITELIQKLKITDDIVITGFVDDIDKPSIYKLADIVYYASLYEGFGVPIIEAQASGVPVITSITSSMPEAAGDAAVFVDPYNVSDIKDAIIRLVDDRDLKNTLIMKGKINASQYTWEKSKAELEYFLTHVSL